MKIAKKILLWFIGLIALTAALMVGLQIYYKQTPSALSPETVQLNARVALLPTVTENGYRLHGLLAPGDVDPVQYGRCLTDANDTHRREQAKAATPIPAVADKAAYQAYSMQSAARGDALAVGCLQDGTRLSLAKALSDIKIKPGIESEQWKALAAATPDPVIVARAQTVWAGDARRLGTTVEAPIPSLQTPLQLERWRIASAVQWWQAGERPKAVSAWKRSINDWVKSADDTLIDAMVSTAALSQIMLGVQDAVARSDRVDDATATAALAALVPIEAMPKAISDSLVAEWQSMSSLVKSMPLMPTHVFYSEAGPVGRMLDQAGRHTHDANDTLNRMAQGNIWAQAAVLNAAMARAPLESSPQVGAEEVPVFCEALGDWQYLCLPLVRNPVGRIMAAIATPYYADYGVRVADLRNLAAVTRLTIEARRRALSGEALANFIANAPAGMRDVFTDKPFVYDAALKRLQIELRAKSPVLGDKGMYQLML